MVDRILAMRLIGGSYAVESQATGDETVVTVTGDGQVVLVVRARYPLKTEATAFHVEGLAPAHVRALALCSYLIGMEMPG